ncbi:MAG: DNA polymerase III subunit [Candidatus Limnocylindria bacterium]
MIGDAPVAGFQTLGQGTAQRTARQASDRGQLGRTLLVQGPAGAGKDAFVGDLLALLFCADPDAATRPCNGCRGCRDARARAHPDLVVGSPELWREARSAGESIVAAARRWLLAAAGAPMVADRRVVLIEGVDRANEQTQNALLKVLEEPTDRHTFVLVADEPQRVLPTIRSRSRPLRIGPVPRADLVAHLVDHMRLPADLAEVVAQMSGGLVGTAVGFVEQSARLEWRGRVARELLALLERGRADRFAAVRDLLDDATRVASPAPSEPAEDMEGDAPRTPASAQREAAVLVVDAWLSLTRDLLVASVGRAELAPSRELGPELERLAGQVGAGPLIEMIGLLERIHEALRQNAAPRLALEAAMLTWPFVSPPTTPAR